MKRSILKLEDLADFHLLCRCAKKAYKSKFTRAGQMRSSEALRFMSNLEDEVVRLKQALLTETYQAGEFRHFWVCDRKPRFISAAPFRDRVVHHAMTALMSPRLESYADDHSYACRPQRGLHRAVNYAQAQARRHEWVLRLDVAHYFETLPHAHLKQHIRRLFKGNSFLRVVDLFIDHAPQGCIQGRGIPIGNLTSQHFANLYLGQLDHALRQEFSIPAYLRYMDDLTLFGHSKQHMREAHAFVADYLSSKLGLALKDKVTEISPTHVGFNMVGFRIFPTYIRFDKSRIRRYRLRRKLLDRNWKMRGDQESIRIRSEALSAWAKVADTYTMRYRHAHRLAKEL